MEMWKDYGKIIFNYLQIIVDNHATLCNNATVNHFKLKKETKMTNEKMLNLFIEILPSLIKNKEEPEHCSLSNDVDKEVCGKYCIIRTYSAGVWAGYVQNKYQNEIILKDARRLWKWHTKSSISLSAIAIDGLNFEYSKICEPVAMVWLQPIEIIPCSIEAKNNIIIAPICETE